MPAADPPPPRSGARDVDREAPDRRFWTGLQALIFRSPAWAFVTGVVAISLVKSGVAPMPNYGMSRQMAVDPFVNSFSDPNAHYLFWNWLGPFVAWAIGARGVVTFNRLHLGFSIAFTALFVGFAFRRLSDRSARIAVLVFVALPASSTIYYWFGMDSLTLLLLMTALVVANRPWLLVPVGVALGMQHFEQATVVVASLAALAALDRALDARACAFLHRPFVSCAALALGIGLGRGVLAVVFRHHGIVIEDRVYRFGNERDALLAQFLFNWQVILWSVLGVAWLATIRYARRGRRAIPFFAVLAGLLALLPFVQDQTRVLGIVTFPLLATCWLFDEEFLDGIAEAEAALFCVVWTFAPWTWVWMGAARGSVFSENIVWLLRACGVLPHSP